MSPDLMLTIIGGLIAVLLSVVAWITVELHAKVKEIPRELKELNNTLHTIEIELRRELGHHDTRISSLETRCDMYHNEKDH